MPADSCAVRVPMEVQYQPAWLTWVAATTTCLRALGQDCDCADVAGMSGYAFVINVHKELCPSGPTVFDWYTLHSGIEHLGRTTACCASGDPRAAYDLVAAEVEAGRPCVIWGAYVPEFAAAVGVEDGAYHVRSFRSVTGEPEVPIRFDELQAPGGPYSLAFPSTVDVAQPDADRAALAHAAEVLSRPAFEGDYGYGPDAAYDTWIAALQANVADPFGNAYNTACWSEGRRFAGAFLTRVALRNSDLVGPVGDAAEAYAGASAAMHRLAVLFPFPQGGDIGNPDVRAQAVDALRDAQAAEKRAATALAAAAAAL
jgi:hypothetical protein